MQHALCNVCFSSNPVCRFHGGGSPLTTTYGSQLLHWFTSFWKWFSMKFQEIALQLSHLFCSPITGKQDICLAVQWHVTTCRKCLKKCWKNAGCLVWKKKREGTTGRKNTFQNEDFSGGSGNQTFPVPTDNRAKKNQVQFLKGPSRINIRKKPPNYTERWVLEQHRMVWTSLF